MTLKVDQIWEADPRQRLLQMLTGRALMLKRDRLLELSVLPQYQSESKWYFNRADWCEFEAMLVMSGLVSYEEYYTTASEA